MSDEVDIVSPKKAHSHRSGAAHNQNNNMYKAILAVLAVLVIGGVGFYSGVKYQKGHTAKTVAATSAFGGQPGGFGARFSGSRTIGTVSAVSSSSISVTPQNGGTAVTYSITSSTAISDNGSTVDYTDIQTGDTVLVSATSSTSKVAARILVNPSFGGGGGFGGGSSSSPTNTTDPNTSLN